MDGLQNIEGEFEPTSPDMFIDWNDDSFQPTFLQSHTSHTVFQNIEETITEFAAVPTPADAESVVEITDPTCWSYQGSSSAAALNFVPNPLSQLPPNSSVLNATQSNHPLSSAEGLMLEGPVPSVQRQDMIKTGLFNQLSELQNEDWLALERIHLCDEQNPCNQPLIPNRIENNNGINNLPSPHPTLVHQNLARSGNSERTYWSGPFAPPERHTLFTQYDDISNSHAAWSSSRSEHTQLSAPDVYGAQYAPNYTQMPHTFTPVHNQVGHVSELEQILDLLSEDTVRPVYPMCSRSEPYSNLEPGFVIMPADAYRRGYRPELPDPAAPSASYLANYGQQSSLFATSTNSFGSQSSVSSTNKRTQPSEAIRRILNMNPTRTVTRNSPSITTEQIQSKSMPIKRVRYEPPCPTPKRLDAEGSSSPQRAKSLKVCTETGKHGSTGTSQTLERTPHGVVIRDPSAVLPNPPSAPRNFENAAYDMEFEWQGQPLEPHLRFFKPPPEN